MANTLKLGAGNWATKESSLLAYNDENGNFKPLPFDFTRDSGATRVNKQGLIEVVGNNEPRIDFKDNSKGALLLEPSRSNNIAYSQDLTNAAWTKTRVDITSENILNPRGVNSSFKITSNNTSESFIQQSPSSVTGSNQTFSFFIKKGNTNFCHITLFDGGSNGFRQWINLSNFTLGTNTSFGTGFTLNNSSIEKYSNGWYRVSMVTNNSGATVFSRINISDTDAGNGSSVGSYLYADMVQFEPNSSYATSYIPTSGSAVTRVADVCSQTVPNDIVKSNEGTLFIDMNSWQSGSYGSSAVSFGLYLDGSQSNAVGFTSNQTVNNLRARMSDSTGSDYIGANFTPTDRDKLAIKWNGTTVSFFRNGSLFYSLANTGGKSYNTISLPISPRTGLFPINDFRVYNTALTDQELINLTTI